MVANNERSLAFAGFIFYKFHELQSACENKRSWNRMRVYCRKMLCVAVMKVNE